VRVVHTHVCSHSEVSTVADAEFHHQDEACDLLQHMMHVKHELQVFFVVLRVWQQPIKSYNVVEKLAELLQHASCQLY